MNRFLFRSSIGMLLCSISVLLIALQAVASEPRPNVLFIAVDDLRPELGCYGVSDIRTPNIDRLAASGVLFQRAYCQVAVCNPSRVSLLTGLRPDSSKVWDLPTRFRHTVPNIVTLPQHFKSQGYRAVSFGKIFHNPWPDNRSWSQPHQWPQNARLWSANARQQLKVFREQMRADGKSEAAITRMRAVATEVVDCADKDHIDGAITQQALQSLRQLTRQEQPFFLAVGFVRPHLPFVVPRRYWEMYDADTIPLASDGAIPTGAPPFAMNTMYEIRDYMDFADAPNPRDGSLSPVQQRRLKHGYYAATSMVDAQVGLLMDELQQLGVDDNTVVVFWSDHGWKLGEHNSWCKQTNYEIDTRVPLIIHQPGAKGNGKSSDALVELLDLYPTLCDLAGLPVPNHVEGDSLAPVLADPNRSVKQAVFSQFKRRAGGQELMGYSMRTDRYRYVQWLRRRSRQPVAHELYDHVADPQEKKNLAGDANRKKLVDQLSKQLWETLPPPPPFTDSGRESKRPVMRFQNRTDTAVKVYWLPDGEPRKLVAQIKPGEQIRQNSTKGHRFLIVGGEIRKTVTVSRAEQTVMLTASTKLSDSDRPNVLVIMGDDWSWPHAGILGDPVVRTPTFDRIAKEGILFEHAFVSTPSCTPSRLALVTGQHHWRLGEGDSLGGSLAADVPVYPDLLASAGYATGYCRKGAAPSQHKYRGNDPFGPRFDDFKKFLSTRDDDQPFCFWYGAGEPHRPYDWQASLHSNLDLDSIRVPACLPDNQTVRTDLGDYYLRVQKLDRLAGNMIKQLESRGELDNTIVIMTGDNGMPFPRCKATLYDGGTRVPLAIRWGDKVTDGQKVDGFVSLTDLAPTILQAAGLPVPTVMTGKSLIPVINGSIATAARDHVLVGREQHVYSWPARGIRTQDFLYVRNFEPTSWQTGAGQGTPPEYDFSETPWPTKPPAFSFNCDPSPAKQWMIQNAESIPQLHRLAFDVPPKAELYDLRTDPDQMTNIAQDPKYKQNLTRLKRQLESELQASGDPRFTALATP